MKKTALILLLVISVLDVSAQAKGIQFFKGTWQQAIEKSIKENKKIFLDCYTVWCGPCKNLADTVFTQDAVADYYNTNFVNISLDMEKADGLALHTRYGIDNFPTMAYFNPGGFYIDRLNGLVSGAELITQGKKISAQYTGVPLEEQFAKGGYKDSVFLRKYMSYMLDTYNQGNYQSIFNDVIRWKGEDVLYEKIYWDILGAANTGSTAGIFLVTNRDKFAKLYGADAVDEKIASMYLNIMFLNNYEEQLRDPNMRDKEHKNDNPYDLFRERLKTRNVPNADFILAATDFYRNCRKNKRTEAFEIASKALINAKPWQYHQMALLGDWLTAGRVEERAKVAVWAVKAAGTVKNPDEKKRYKLVVADLKNYAPDMIPKPMIYDFTI